MLMSLKYWFARQIPQTVPFLESKRSGLRSLWTAPSLSSLQCCSSSVSHHVFTHLAINLGPCVLGCTGCEPGRLLGWNLQSARFCSSCTDTVERWELVFWLIPWGFQQIICLHAYPGCHPPQPSLIGDEATQVATHSGHCGVSNSTPNRRVDVVSLNWSSGSISHDRRWFSSWKATLVPLPVVKCCVSIYSQGPGTLSTHNASVSTWVLLRRSQNYTLGK